MANAQGMFTVKSTWEIVRSKHEPRRDFEVLWNKGLPFKINFFLWRVWKRKIATDDNLKKMRINIASKCWCCDRKEKETMTHLFLTAPIANMLWRYFALFTGINIKGMHLQQLIISWWKQKATPKLQSIYRAIPTIIMWSLWKRRNALKHGNVISWEGMVEMTIEVVRQMVKTEFPWIKKMRWSWQEIVHRLNQYKPKIHYLIVTWKPPKYYQVKCNTDGACRGNPG
ncbi:hypothetical protein KY284_000611 [Solanum tuberosum]|nr:hypothetical protein KY284_000611 [Solanum tuberosum]